MKSKQRGWIDLPSYGEIFAVGAIAGAIVMGVAFIVVPWVWGWIRPLLHALTA